jgi:hypothetical protein
VHESCQSPFCRSISKWLKVNGENREGGTAPLARSQSAVSVNSASIWSRAPILVDAFDPNSQKKCISQRRFSLEQDRRWCGSADKAQGIARSAAQTFGGDSAIELISATVVFWRFHTVKAGVRNEPRAARIAGSLLFALAAYVVVVSALALIGHREAKSSLVGIAVLLAAAIIMPLLARQMRLDFRQHATLLVFPKPVSG